MGKSSRRKKGLPDKGASHGIRPDGADAKQGRVRKTSREYIPLFAGLIALVSFAIYFNALSNGLVYDDLSQVIENRWIKDIKYIPDMFSKSVWSFQSESIVSNYYRPMMHLIYLVTFYIFGLKPFGFHLVNIFFHSGVSVLVFLVASRLLSSRQLSAISDNPPLSPLVPPFIAALLFATHPIHTEAVTWVAGLPDLSYTLFFLLSLYLYIITYPPVFPHDPLLPKRSRLVYWLSVLSFAVATFCKEPALMLPFLLMAYDWVFARMNTRYTLHSTRFFLKRYLPYFAIAAIYLGLRFHALKGFSPQRPHTVLTAYGYIVNVFALFVQYLKDLIFPLNLNAFHVFHPITSITQPAAILFFTLTAIFMVMTLIAFRKKSKLSFALLAMALPLLPALYIPALGENVFAERYLYLPSFGFTLLIAISLSSARAVNPRLTSGLLIFFFITTLVFSAAAIKRNRVWKDDLTLFKDIVRKSPDSPIMRNSLGVAYLNNGRLPEAEREFVAALRLRPSYAEAHTNLGNAYLNQNRLKEALSEYLAVIKLKPDPEAHYNLGNAYAKVDRFDEAEKELIVAFNLKPDFADAHNNLGVIYVKQNRLAEAVNEYAAALKLNPDYTEARYNLGYAYLRQDRLNEAATEFKEAIRLNPGLSPARKGLEISYARMQASKTK